MHKLSALLAVCLELAACSGGDEREPPPTAFPNTAQLSTLFALSNLWMARKTLQVLDGQVRAQTA
jgi:hypothetical protein